MILLVVTKFAARGKARDALIRGLSAAGFDPHDLRFDSVVPAGFPFDQDVSRADIAEARERFAEVVTTFPPTAILGFGNEALSAISGHSGIMKWRGKMLTHKANAEVVVTSTISLAAAERTPSQAMNLQADLVFLYKHLTGQVNDDHEPKDYRVVATRETLAELIEYLSGGACEAVAFDIETNGFDEFAEGAFMVSIAVTTLSEGGYKVCWVVPLHHRASVWRSQWEKVLTKICTAMRQVPTRIAHNAKFDCRWLVHFGGGVPCNFDTMLAAHLLNENRAKGLKPLARLLLGAPEWDVSTKSSKTVPWYNQVTLKEILRYNGLDTWHTMRLYEVFDADLDKQPRVGALFSKLMMPASQSLVHIERAGVYVDREALSSGAQVVAQELKRIDDALMRHVPIDERPNANFNPSNFLKWWLFEHLDLPILEYTKSGAPSTAEGVLSKLTDDHEVIPLLLERVKWNKFQSSFFNPYADVLTHDDRIRTTFKLNGTVTGRLSSGKGDADKVTGARAGSIRGVNLQQVPRDPLVRSLFGAAPGWTFIEADYSQIELRIAAWIAQESTMLMLYATGQDIHMTMAMRMTGKPAEHVTSEERKKAKAVNFGFLYGMGANKFIETAWNNYGVKVTEPEAQAFRRAFFEEFPKLKYWHARQRRLAHQYKRVESPIGRIRHLPDIDSPDKGVVGEAERQSINSPVQAMASDLCLLSMVLIDRQFRKRGMKSHPIGTVHDAINFEIHDDELDDAIAIIKHTMEHPPLEKLFGVSLNVPIIADMKVGTRWGTGKEL